MVVYTGAKAKSLTPVLLIPLPPTKKKLITMKTMITVNALLICFGIVLFTYCFNRDCVKIDKGVAYVEYFKQGDILNPDYACPDTLIVIDAIGLNKAIAPIEQGKADATDKKIADIMYKYCKVK